MLRCHSSFPNLDTHDDVTIPFDGTGCFSRTGIREVSEFFCKGRVKSQARDMHESQNSNRRLINGVLAEVGKIGKATRSGVDRCSDSMVQRNVRIDPIDASLKPMAVEVHQTGANILPLEIQNLAAFAGIKLRANVEDLARFDPYIPDAVNGLGRINDVAFLEQQIVFRGHRASSHRLKSRGSVVGRYSLLSSRESGSEWGSENLASTPGCGLPAHFNPLPRWGEEDRRQRAFQSNGSVTRRTTQSNAMAIRTRSFFQASNKDVWFVISKSFGKNNQKPTRSKTLIDGNDRITLLKLIDDFPGGHSHLLFVHSNVCFGNRSPTMTRETHKVASIPFSPSSPLTIAWMRVFQALSSASRSLFW